jgi:hypothetical protein
MGKNRINRGHSVEVFTKKFGVALEYFSAMMKETSPIGHSGNKGEEREFNVSEFIGNLLPMRYRCVAGEVVDLLGQRSPSLDALIYDRDKNFPFYSGKREVISAESLLASIEVKSVLNMTEFEQSFKSAEKLKSLKPNKQPLGTAADKGSPFRYFHCLFALSTDLSGENWAEKELARAKLKKRSAPGQDFAIDLVYVLGRGLINLNNSVWIPEDNDNGQALLCLFYSIYNFAERENGRRSPSPFISYANDLNKNWRKL